jgi:hypothetical protein
MRRFLPWIVGVASIGLASPSVARAQACSDSEYVARFISVDRWTVHGRARIASYVKRFETKQIDTAFVGYHPGSFVFGPSWFVRFADDPTEYGIHFYDVSWRHVQPSRDARDRFHTLQTSLVCISTDYLDQLRHPPVPHEVTYDDIIFAQMEPSYVTMPFGEFGLPKESHRDLESGGPSKDLSLMYEAVIAPPFLIRSPSWPWSVAITPRVVLRQYAGGSAPVPPPSYMPRATLYYWGPGLRSMKADDPNSFPYAWFMFSHHSNGQEGDPIDSATKKPNYATGNFSTNFVEAGASFTRSEPTAGFAGLQLAATYYPDSWSDAHQHLFGHGRIRVAEDVIAPFNVGAGSSARVRLELTWMGGPMGDEFHTLRRRFNYSATYILNPHAQDFSTFINAYDGQDYYNIRYDRRIRIIRIGFIATSLHFKFGVPKIP